MISLHDVTTFILDTLFPIHCLSCDQEGRWLCDTCASVIALKPHQECPACRKKNNGSVCIACRTHTALDGLLVATNYEEPLIQKLVHTLKYQSIPDIAVPLAGIMNTCINHYQAGIIHDQYAALVPIPLHKRRQRMRGFNQSELIAQNIARIERLPVINLLLRNRHTDSQMTLAREDRLKNVVDAFGMNPDFKNIPKNVILIDDVATTLATLHECASVLKSHGVSTVWGIVAARGS